MSDFAATADHYETLQVSKNADPDTIQRVFRLLAQRFHPDNPDSGNAERFRQIHEAYVVLSDAEKRAQYDVHHEDIRQERWRFVMGGPPAENDFELEQHMRFLLLEILYTQRRTEPNSPGLSPFDLSRLTGRPAEHLDFSIWYLTQKKLVGRSDQALLTITAAGVDYLEQHPRASQERLRLTGSTVSKGA